MSVLLKGQVGDYLYKNTRNPFARFVGVTGMTVGSVIGFEQLALEIPGFFASSIAGGTTIVAAAIGLHAGLVPELEDGTIIFYRWTKAIGSLPTAPLAVARGASRGKEMKHLVGEFQDLQLVIPLPPSISSASSSSLTEADVESYFHTVFIPKGIKLNGDQKLIQIIQQRKMVPFNSTDEGSIAHEQFSFLKRIKLFRNCSSVYNEVTELGWNKAIQLGKYS